MIPFIYSKPPSYNDKLVLYLSDKVSKYPDNDVHLIEGNKSENPNKSIIYLTADKKLKIYVNTVIDIDNSVEVDISSIKFSGITSV